MRLPRRFASRNDYFIKPFTIVIPAEAVPPKAGQNGLKLLDSRLHGNDILSKESCPVRPIPAYKAGLYGLTENRQLSESNSKPPFIPVHRTGHSGNFSNL